MIYAIELLVFLVAPVAAIVIGSAFLGSFFLTIRADAHSPGGVRRLFSVRTVDATGWVLVVLFLEIVVLGGFRAIPNEDVPFLLIRILLQGSLIAVLIVRLIHWRRLQSDAARERAAFAALHKEEAP